MENKETNLTTTIFVLIIIGIIIWFLYIVRNILMPFIISAILAYLLFPIVKLLQSRGMKRIVAVILMYLFFVLIFIGGISLLVPQIVKEVDNLRQNLPGYVNRVKTFALNLQDKFEDKYPILERKAIVENSIGKIQDFISKGLSNIPNFLSGIFSTFTLIFLIPVITFFFILRGGNAMDKLFEIIPSRYIETTLSIFWEIDEVLGRFIRGQIVEATFVAILSTMGLMIIGVNYAILIGIVAGISNMIPYLGPFIGGSLGVIIGLIQYQHFYIVLEVIVVFSAVQFIDNNFIQPIVMSKGVKLNPAIIIFSVMAGAEIYGIIGMLLAVPVAGVLKTILEIFLKRKTRIV